MFDDDFLQNEIIKNMEKIEFDHANKYLRNNVKEIFDDIRNECKDFRNNVFYKKMADLDEHLDDAYIRHKKDQNNNIQNHEKENEERQNKDKEYGYKKNSINNKKEYGKKIQSNFDKKEYFEDNQNKKKVNISNDYYYKYDDFVYKKPYKTGSKKIIEKNAIEYQEEGSEEEGEESEDKKEKYNERKKRINNDYNVNDKKNENKYY